MAWQGSTHYPKEMTGRLMAICEDAPCCGCCGTNIYGVYQGDGNGYHDSEDNGYDYNDEYNDDDDNDDDDNDDDDETTNVIIIVNGTREMPGCYIGDQLGQYMICSLVDLALGYGIAVPDEYRELLKSDNWTDDNSDSVYWAADKVEELLNDNTVNGYWSFEADAGGFFLSANTERDDD